MGKRTDYTSLRMGFGLSRGLGDEFIQACERNNVPIEAIHRLVTPKGHSTMDEIACRILTDWQAEQPKPVDQSEGGHPYRGGPTNGNASFSAQVVYIQPEFEELKRRFPAYFNPNYKGKRFDPIERCKAVPMDIGDREVAFEYVHMDRNAFTDEVLAEMDRKWLRPALYEELLSFAEKYPDELRKDAIVALGSEARVSGLRFVAFLWCDGFGRYLDLRWVGSVWDGLCRFLAVRK